MGYNRITIWDDKELTQPEKSVAEIDKKNVSKKRKISKNNVRGYSGEIRNTSVIGYLKRKRWGFRHSLYALFLGFFIQLIFIIPAMINNASEIITSGSSAVTTESIVDAVMSAEMLVWIQMAMYLGWIFVALYITYRKGLNSLAKDIWLKFRWIRDISFGLVIAAALRGIEMSTLWLLDTLGVDLTGADNSSVFMETTGVWKYILLFGIVSLIGPIAEEILFRGIMMQGIIKTLRRTSPVPRTWFGEGVYNAYPPLFQLFSKLKLFLNKYKYILAVIISSTIFGFMHYQGGETFGQWLVVIITGLLGVVLALVTLKTRRLGLAIVIHIGFNGSAVIMSLMA